MPKPTKAEVADLVGRLHRDANRIWDEEKLGAPAAPDSFEEYLTARLEREAADAIEALAGEGAEPVTLKVTEVRLHTDGTIDELVGRGRFHLEQMDFNHWWMCLTGQDGREVHVWLHSKSKITATYESSSVLVSAPPAKPAGELPPLPEHTAIYLSHYTGKNLWQWNPCLSRPPTDTQTALYTAADMRAYALRALRESA